MRYLALVCLLCCLPGCVPSHRVAVHGADVRLSLQAPEARSVQFACSADRFALREADRDRDGLWTIEIDNVADKEFLYFFVVDGVPHTPDCRFRQNDDFGAANCLYLPWVEIARAGR